MKKINFLFALALVMGLGMSAFAQDYSTDNASVLGKALVLQRIDVTGVTALDFGWVSPGLAKTINLENIATGGQAGEGTQTTGVFTVSAAVGSNVQIEFTTLPANLSYLTNELPIGSYTAGYHTANPFDGVATFEPGTGAQVSNGNFPANDLGSSVNGIYVFIGATVSPGLTQASGDYEAAITLTATYN
jgi:hypothetical protein